MRCYSLNWRTESGCAADVSGVPIRRYEVISVWFDPLSGSHFPRFHAPTPSGSEKTGNIQTQFHWLTSNSEANKTHRPAPYGAV